MKKLAEVQNTNKHIKRYSNSLLEKLELKGAPTLQASDWSNDRAGR